MVRNKSRCSYCGRILHKQVSEKYIVCSIKCKSLITNTEYIVSIDSIVFSLNNYKWNKVEDLSKKAQINKFDFVSSVRRLIYFQAKLRAKDAKEINQKSLISKVKK
tara:strand:+ start:964 stop:1281 length:318 start_codon:yes stop_codon:yes gene_type:complete